MPPIVLYFLQTLYLQKTNVINKYTSFRDRFYMYRAILFLVNLTLDTCDEEINIVLIKRMIVSFTPNHCLLEAFYMDKLQFYHG